MIYVTAYVDKDNVCGIHAELPYFSNDIKAAQELLELAERLNNKNGVRVVMGHETWKAIGTFPRYENIVLSRYNRRIVGAKMAKTEFEVAGIAKRARKDYLVIGGESTFRSFVPLADCIIINHVANDIKGGVMFPNIPKVFNNITKLEGKTIYCKQGVNHAFNI
jgi:dihydrofolate reductase